MKIYIIAEDIPRQRLWRVRWDYKEAVRKHLISALVRAWWRNRKYVASCANAPLHGRGTPRTVGEDVGQAKGKKVNEHIQTLV